MPGIGKPDSRKYSLLISLQSPTTALTATANPYMIAVQPDLMYAQVPTQAYQPTDFTDATMLDSTAGVEVMSNPYAL